MPIFGLPMEAARSIARPVSLVPAQAAMAAMIGWLLVSPGIAPALVLAATPAFAALWLHPDGKRLAIFAALAAIPVVSGIALATNSQGSMLRRIDDFFLLAGIAALLFQGRELPRSCRVPALMAFAALAASELAGLAAGWTSPTVTLGAAWQDVRWLGAIGLGLALGRRMTSSGCRRGAAGLLVAWCSLNLAVSVVQIASASLANQRFGLTVASGAFGHPTFGAIAGTCLLLYVAAERLSRERRFSDASAVAIALLAVANLVVSLRLKAFLAIAVALLFLALQADYRRKPLVAAAFAVVPLLVLPGIGVSQELSARAWGGSQGLLADAASHEAPRVSLMNGAKQLASEHWPIGAGLGTFGSNLDPRLEDATFAEAGLGGTFGLWGDDTSFRSDSQIAHTLAERGYLGMALWILGLALILVAAVRLPGASLYPATAFVAAITAASVSPSLISGPAVYMFFLPAGLELAAGLCGRPSR